MKKKTIKISTVLFCVLLFVSGCESKKNTKKSGVEGEQNKEYIHPELKRLSVAISKEPENLSLRKDRLLWYLEKNYITEANEEARYLISRDTLNPSFWGLLGRAKFKNADLYRAQNAMNKGLLLDENCVHCLEGIAEIKLAQRKYDEAIEYVNKALKVNDKYFYPYHLKGWAYMEAGDTVLAVSSFRTAIELHPSFYDGYMMLGSLFYKANHPLCIQYFESASAIDPKNVEPFYFKGMYFQNRDSLEAALSAYNQLLSIDSTYAQAHFNKGYIYMVFYEDYEQAHSHFSNAIQWNEEYYKAYYNRALCLKKMDREAEAYHDLKTTLQLNPMFTPAREEMDLITN